MAVLRHVSFGPLRVRTEVPLALVAVWVWSGSLKFALSLFLAILFHELGHTLAALVLSPVKPRLVLQLGGGNVYLKKVEGGWRAVLILLAGPLFSMFPVAIGYAWQLIEGPGHGLNLIFAGLVWSAFQISPLPPLDGGMILGEILERWLGSATAVWRVGWFLGLSLAFAIAFADIWFELGAFFEPVVWLVGLAVILGRDQAGYVRYVDAFKAWEAGEHADVVEMALHVPEYLDPRDKDRLAGLGVVSALESEDEESLIALLKRLPAYDPAVVDAAEWLLRRHHAYGAKMAERAFDALDAGDVSPKKMDRDKWADLAFRLAVHEAYQKRFDSSVGMLERSVELGFDNLDRLLVESAFDAIREHPRFLRIVQYLENHPSRLA